MTENEKQLLIKDLCARLPYGVRVSITAHNLDYENDFGKTIIAELTGILTAKDDDGTTHTCFITCYDEFKTQGNDIDTIKPYLRPMSTMTKEEKEEVRQRFCYEWEESIMELYYSIEIRDIDCFIDWLNEHHFDYRGLIEKSLAIIAPEDMYK